MLGDETGSKILKFLLSLTHFLKLSEFPLLLWGSEGRPFPGDLKPTDLFSALRFETWDID